MNSDFKERSSLFNDNGVRYLVIGGYAVDYHAELPYRGALEFPEVGYIPRNV